MKLLPINRLDATEAALELDLVPDLDVVDGLRLDGRRPRAEGLAISLRSISVLQHNCFYLSGGRGRNRTYSPVGNGFSEAPSLEDACVSPPQLSSSAARPFLPLRLLTVQAPNA